VIVVVGSGYRKLNLKPKIVHKTTFRPVQHAKQLEMMNPSSKA